MQKTNEKFVTDALSRNANHWQGSDDMCRDLFENATDIDNKDRSHSDQREYLRAMEESVRALVKNVNDIFESIENRSRPIDH